MGGYEAILFDFDGVLVDSEPLHYACWTEALEPLGVEIDWKTYGERCTGVADRDLREFLGSLATPPVSGGQLDGEGALKKRLFVERMTANPPVPEDTRRLLDELEPYRLAVVSSSERMEVEPILAAARLRSRFDELVFADDVARCKPDPEPYLLAVQRLGVRRALVVEDSTAGIASGHAAGLDVLRIDSPESTGELVRRHLDRSR